MTKDTTSPTNYDATSEQLFQRITAPFCNEDGLGTITCPIEGVLVEQLFDCGETGPLDVGEEELFRKLSIVAIRGLVFTEDRRLPEREIETLEEAGWITGSILSRIIEEAQRLEIEDIQLDELVEIAGQGLCYYLTGKPADYTVAPPDYRKIDYEGADLIPEGWTSLSAKGLIDDVENAKHITNEQQKKLISLMKSYGEMLLVGPYARARLDLGDRVTIDRFTRIAKRAETLFYQKNISLVRSQAALINIRDKGLLEEIIQEGSAALFDAAFAYDNDLYDVDFDKFATFRIKGAMVDYLRASGKPIRLPRSMIRDMQLLNDLEVKGMSGPEICEELGISETRLAQLRNAKLLLVTDSLDQDSPEGDSVSRNLSDVPGFELESAGETLDKFHETVLADKKLIMDLVKKARFSGKERTMLFASEGINPNSVDEDGRWLEHQLNRDGKQTISLHEIADYFGFSESRACQLLAFLRLRLSMAASISLIAKATSLSENQEGYLTSFFTPKNKWGDPIDKPSPTQVSDALRQVHEHLGREIEAAISVVVDGMNSEECHGENLECTYLTLCYDLGVRPSRLSGHQTLRTSRPYKFTNRKYYQRLVSVLEIVTGKNS